MPDLTGLPKYSAEDMVNIYKSDIKEIFHKSFLRKLETGFGLWGAKYNRENLDSILKKMFGDLRISQTLYPTYIPVYSITNSNVQIINTAAAKLNDKNDFYVRDAAGATTAAPTYFAPKNISNIYGNISYYAADGGIYANDPEIISTIIVCNTTCENYYDDTILLSIGTNSPENKQRKIRGNNGVTGWLNDKDLINDMINAEMDFDARITANLFKAHRYRLEVSITNEMNEMDNASTQNLKTLLQTTNEYIENNSQLIDELCHEFTIVKKTKVVQLAANKEVANKELVN